MKIAVLSDIHGNKFALEAVINDILKKKVDQIIVLGDIITDIPHYTNDVINIIKEFGTYVIQGNRENIIINNLENYQYDQFLTTRMTINELSNENLEYIKLFPENISIKYNKNISIKCVHGTPFSNSEQLMENDKNKIDNIINTLDEKILLVGHTHNQWKNENNNKIILNPGSVGLNFNGNRMAQYAIIYNKNNNMKIELEQIRYDFETFKLSCDLSIPWIRLCIKGMEYGKLLTLSFLDEAIKKTSEYPIPNDIWNNLFKEWCDKNII